MDERTTEAYKILEARLLIGYALLKCGAEKPTSKKIKLLEAYALVVEDLKKEEQV